MLTSRERLLKVLRGELPDCVPVCPDFSYMIPAKMTGKPFWDVFLYNDPPLYEAYIECAKYFDIDSLMDGSFNLHFPEERAINEGWGQYIVFKDNTRIVTQEGRKENGKWEWKPKVTVYYIDNPPTWDVDPVKIGLEPVPKEWEPIERVSLSCGPESLKRAKELMGNHGLIGVFATKSVYFQNQNDIYKFYDNPEKHEQWAEEYLDAAVKRFERINSLETKPDFICVGGSGTLVTQTMEMFLKIAFPAVKKVIELATEAGFPTHVHSCGPEKELVKIFSEQTELTVIDPLEEPPMGDCNLAELKKLYGDKIILKGNLHTTNVMLLGSIKDVIKASKSAIDQTAEGGRFILSTGDQCGRDTPYENIFAMVETARSYGEYS